MDSLINQTMLPSKIILNISKVYNFRFNNLEISSEKINTFRDKYQKYNVFINLIDEDFGPGTKLLGLLNSNYITDNDRNENTYIVLVDDDLIYKPFMIEQFNHYINLYKHIEVGSYYVYSNYIAVGQGADGFFMKLNLMDKFLQYYNVIKDKDYLLYHDDFYISYYFLLLNKNVEHILRNNPSIYDFQINSEIDALRHLNGKYSRGNLFVKPYEILNHMNLNGKFKFLN
jgi:hypothetical protein